MPRRITLLNLKKTKKKTSNNLLNPFEADMFNLIKKNNLEKNIQPIAIKTKPRHQKRQKTLKM